MDYCTKCPATFASPEGLRFHEQVEHGDHADAKSSVGAELQKKVDNPLIFKDASVVGKGAQPRPVHGYDVTLLIDVCKAILEADSAGEAVQSLKKLIAGLETENKSLALRLDERHKYEEALISSNRLLAEERDAALRRLEHYRWALVRIFEHYNYPGGTLQPAYSIANRALKEYAPSAPSECPNSGG